MVDESSFIMMGDKFDLLRRVMGSNYAVGLKRTRVQKGGRLVQNIFWIVINDSPVGLAAP